MSLMDILRAAVPAAAAARGGYLQGEQIAEDRARKLEEQRIERARQSRLDEIRAAYEQAQADEASARADALRHPKPAAAPAPHTIETNRGIMQWDPETRTFVPTGMQPPARAPRAGADPAEIAARNRREGRLRTNQSLQATRAQIKDLSTQADTAELDADPKDQAAMSRVAAIRAEIAPLRRDADSLTAAIKSPENAARYDATQQRFIPLTGGEDVSAPRSTPTRGGSVLRGGGAASGSVVRGGSSASTGNVDLRQPASSDPTEVAAQMIRDGRATLEQLDASGKSKAFKDSVKARLARRP